MAAKYPIRAVSRLTGISLDTLRAWERRYSVVSPERTERGRLYSDEEIQRLMLLRDLVARGHSIGQIAPLSDEELKDLGRRSAEVERAHPVREEQASPALAPLLAAIERFDATAANEEMGRLAALVPAFDLVVQVALPLMRVVGDRWHNGTISIAQEHMASAVLRHLFGSLLRLYKPSEPPVRILLATPSGESHEFGILAAAMLAAPMGLEPVYLGPNLPSEEIVSAAVACHAKAIVVGVLNASHDALPQLELRKLAGMAPVGVEVWVGGRGAGTLPDDVRERVTAVDDFEMLEGHLRRLKAQA